MIWCNNLSLEDNIIRNEYAKDTSHIESGQEGRPRVHIFLNINHAQIVPCRIYNL